MSENSIGIPDFHYYGVFSGHQRKVEQELRETGVKVSADITDCLHTNIQVESIGGGTHRLRKLVCSCVIDGRTYVFQSGLLYGDPRPYLMPDKKVTVYYDRINMSRHFVDVESSAAENYSHYIKHLTDSGMTHVEPRDSSVFLDFLKFFGIPFGLYMVSSLFFDISQPILFWFGATLICFGIGIYREQKKKYAHYTESVIGIVVDNRGEFTAEKTGVYTYYYPIVTFEVGGREIKAEYKERRRQPLEASKQVPILYNKSNPFDYYLFNDGEFPHKEVNFDNGKWYTMSFSVGGELSLRGTLLMSLIIGGIGSVICFFALF